MDEISNLPDEVLDLILEKLPLIDKVRTSALSRIWRSRWTRHPSLIIDHEWYRSVNIGRSVPMKNVPLEHARIVESVVLQHRGCMREFSLSVPDHYDLCPTSLSIYKDVICSAISKSSSSLEKLVLAGVDEDDDLLLLPSSIFSLVVLRHLEIYCFQFRHPSWFEGFPNLTLFSLVLDRVSNDTISQFVSVCPQLETVCLEYLCRHEQNLDLPAPRLCRLQLRGYLNDIFVSNAQNLDSISLISEYRNRAEKGISAETFRFLGSATQLNHISLNGEFCEILGRCSIIHMLPKYDLMRSFEIEDIILKQADQLQSILSLLAATPKLRKLKLGMVIVPLDNEDDAELYESMIEKYINADFEYLVRVDLSGIVGTKIQMKMVESLLCFSPVLEMMRIQFHAEEELKLHETVTRFHRTSTKARLHFINTLT